MERFYVDTCVWMDFIDNRRGYQSEILSLHAYTVFERILKGAVLVISDVLLDELAKHYGEKEVEGLLLPFQRCTELFFSNNEQHAEAIELAFARNLPRADALHVVVARDAGAILVTRDTHFKRITDVCSCRKPEDL
jgi:predicted nucleic acid-binding protein